MPTQVTPTTAPTPTQTPAMTVNEAYRTAGFRLSLQVSQDEIDRAERDVTAAYVAKVAPGYDPDAVREAVMQLAFILLCQRATVATRSGGKVKTTPYQSENGYPSQGDLENADRLLRAIRTEDGEVSELVDDICGIYYRQKYLSL